MSLSSVLGTMMAAGAFFSCIRRMRKASGRSQPQCAAKLFKWRCKVKLALTFLLLAPLPGVSREQPYGEPEVRYVIQAELDTTRHAVFAEEEITYRNNSPDTLYDFYLHLYERAFRSDKSHLMRDARKHNLLRALPKRNRGDVTVSSFELLSIGETTDLPVTAYHIDDTVLRAELPKPLAPGMELRLRLRFREKLRLPLGARKDRPRSYELLRWYPEVAVYDEEGWHAEPFRLLSGTYSEFADFEVTLTVPGNFVVVATGVPVAGEPGWQWVAADTSLDEKTFRAWHDSTRNALAAQALRSGSRTVTFRALRVSDFSVVAATDLVYERGERGALPIHIFYRPRSRKAWCRKAVERVARLLAWYESKFGRYPYPQLSVVQGSGDSVGRPMLLVSRSASEISLLFLLGRLYFHGILQNDERTSAWLSNGLAMFATKWYLEGRYGPLGYDKEQIQRRGPFFLKLYPLPSLKQLINNILLVYMDSGADEPMGKVSTGFSDLAGYGMNAFLKGAVFFELLRYVVGDRGFNRLCREYYKRSALEHVDAERLQQIAEEVTGEDLDVFFQQWLRDTPQIDYALADVRTERMPEGTWRTRVVVERRGDGILPVEVALEMPDGEKIVKRVPGKALRDTVVFVTTEKPGGAVLDPEDQILDKDRLNNAGMRYELRFDLPLIDVFYQPRDAYLLLWRPSIGSNDIDGLRLGMQLRGAHRGIYRAFKVGAYYGFRSRTVDGVIKFRHPLPGLGSLSRYELTVQRMVGRFDVKASFFLPVVRGLNTPPLHRFRLVFNHSRLLDEAYGVREVKARDEERLVREWDRGIVNRIALFYRLERRGLTWFADLRGTAEAAAAFLGSDYDERKLSAEVTFGVRPLGFTLVGRAFAGIALGRDAPPLQDQFWIDGADPRYRYGQGMMRTRGDTSPLWRFRVLGGGNLRGYADQPRSGKRLIAGTLEVRRRLPLLGLPLAAFYDVGRLQHVDGRQETLADAGVGLRLEARFGPVSLPDVVLRIDFPIWVSDPLPGDSRRKFRWTVGLGLPWP